jgi:hypothetical protein
MTLVIENGNFSVEKKPHQHTIKPAHQRMGMPK